MKLSRRQALVAGFGGVATATLSNPLFAATVHNYQPDTECLEQRQVVHDVGKVRCRNGVSTQQDHEGLAAMGADVRGRIPEPARVGRRVHGGGISLESQEV